MSQLVFRRIRLATIFCTAVLQLGFVVAGDDARDTPLVRAVQQSKKSVVNIHTERMSEDEKDSKFFNSKPSITQNLAKVTVLTVIFSLRTTQASTLEK